MTVMGLSDQRVAIVPRLILMTSRFLPGTRYGAEWLQPYGLVRIVTLPGILPHGAGQVRLNRK